MTENCVEQLLKTDPRVPTSTYRVQMHKGFKFADAGAIVPYLKQLGIGDFYSSPIFEARPGSMHGYDVTRQDRLNPELGGREAFLPFSEQLQAEGLGLLLDIVPNHMGIGNDAIWWQDVLENGHASKYAEFFDIDWHPLKPEMKNKLLLPILGNQYGDELESKHIQITIEDGKPYIKYFDHTMPVAPRTVPMLFFRRPIGTFPSEMEAGEDFPRALYDLLRDLSQIPPHESSDPGLKDRRQQQLEITLPRLHEVLGSEEVQPIVNAALQHINGQEGNPVSFDHLNEVLDAQPYRLAFWRTSAEEINYRRFFDVNDLVGLRMENPEVFAQTHCLIRELLASHQVTGLRIDHCDGMFNPRQYLIRLQLLYLASQCNGGTAQGDVAANGIERSVLDQVRGYDWAASQGPLYVVVEKILEPREYMPREWPVRGTSGYDFVYFANSIFIQREHEKQFNALYAYVLGWNANPDDIIYRSKLQVMQNSLASEVHVLSNLLSQVASSDRYARDFTDNILETALRETIACFPVYRTYIDDRGEYTQRDIEFIQKAISTAKRRNPDVDASVFDFLQDMLLLKKQRASAEEGKREKQVDPKQLYFALKFQQLTGPVMAKGVEDTTFYVYNRFISSNEVGGSAKSFGIGLDLLHASNQERLENSPDSMLTTSTHDTKRSEDVRNRLNVLSEMPKVWSNAVRRWQRSNSKYKRKLGDGRVAPDGNEEYLLYQTIVGAWPWSFEGTDTRKEFLQRIQEYSTKALSEAKVNLSWLNPNPEYVEAVHGFIADILMPDKRGRDSAFVDTLNKMLPQLLIFGAVNSLAQLVLKVVSPGVPDFYQGTDLWDLSLVDPDNRRPVDYGLRERLLREMKAAAVQSGATSVAQEVTRDLGDGRIKLWTMARALELRQAQHELFRHGDYIELRADRDYEQHLIGFARQARDTGETVLAMVPRFAYTLAGGKAALPLGDIWGKAKIALPNGVHGRFRNVFTDEIIDASSGALNLAEVFATYPVALLTNRQ